MAASEEEKQKKETEKAEKADRLSQALRANLQRRKAQTRGRKVSEAEEDAKNS